MSEPKSPEANQAKAKKEQKVLLKKQMAMIRSIKETMSHDREKCTCEGCHNYAIVGTIWQNGRLYSVVDDWDKISSEEFERGSHRFLQYKMDKQTSPDGLIKKLVDKGIPEAQAKVLVTQMLSPIHMVFFRPPPMGLMKEI